MHREEEQGQGGREGGGSDRQTGVERAVGREPGADAGWADDRGLKAASLEPLASSSPGAQLATEPAGQANIC